MNTYQYLIKKYIFQLNCFMEKLLNILIQFPQNVVCVHEMVVLNVKYLHDMFSI